MRKRLENWNYTVLCKENSLYCKYIRLMAKTDDFIDIRSFGFQSLSFIFSSKGLEPAICFFGVRNPNELHLCKEKYMYIVYVGQIPCRNRGILCCGGWVGKNSFSPKMGSPRR